MIDFQAVAFLSMEALQAKPVKLLAETQILLRDYVHVRHGMHEPYRVYRAANPTSLFHDFARSSGLLQAQSDGSTLVNAASRGQVNVVQRLLDSGKCTVDEINAGNKCSALYMACVNNHVDVVATLIRSACDINLARQGSITPFPLSWRCATVRVCVFVCPRAVP